jgi:NMD protein affecting ribosome stability and mRNA decay
MDGLCERCGKTGEVEESAWPQFRSLCPSCWEELARQDTDDAFGALED